MWRKGKTTQSSTDKEELMAEKKKKKLHAWAVVFKGCEREREREKGYSKLKVS